MVSHGPQAADQTGGHRDWLSRAASEAGLRTAFPLSYNPRGAVDVEVGAEPSRL
jgi:hypothetical protein